MRASRRLCAGGGSVRGICGAHGGHETAEVRDVRKTDGGRGLRRGAGKRGDGVSPGRPQSFQYQRRPVDGCSPGRRGTPQDCRTRGESQGWTTACGSMPERDVEVQSKRARAGSLAIVNWPQVARTCILRSFLFADVVVAVVYLTLTDPLRIQPWSQDRRNQTKSNRKSEISRESRQKRTDKKVASKGLAINKKMALRNLDLLIKTGWGVICPLCC